ncbi:hypothetical protein [Nocardia sp. NPDC051832]|uniref:hypothetical protein n=1 Tax=Nocardia sp. NPDC051832 TaxID=3155673 RepID=UPI003442C5B2
MDTDFPALVFGIYPGGFSPTETMPPDDPGRIQAALAALQPDPGYPLLVRCYLAYDDGMSVARMEAEADPKDFTRYLTAGRRLDLVVSYQSETGDIDGYQNVVRELVRRFGPVLSTLQITEEPNVGSTDLVDDDITDLVDGKVPHVREALVAGVLAGKAEALRSGWTEVQVGFNVAPSFDGDTFFAELGEIGGTAWSRALDYVGLDCFPDVWMHPVDADGRPGDLRDAMVELLRWLRGEMASAGIPPTTPIHITEHGWPTGTDRTAARQAAVIEHCVRSVHEHRAEFNVRAYELWSLRDGNSRGTDLFDQFGIMLDDYTPKPAFTTYRNLIAELSQR